eukprot:261004-Hanusia_phi.AAC.2
MKDSNSFPAEPFEGLKASTRRPYSRQQEGSKQGGNFDAKTTDQIPSSSVETAGKDGVVRLVRSAKVFRQCRPETARGGSARSSRLASASRGNSSMCRNALTESRRTICVELGVLSGEPAGRNEE